MLSLSLHLIAFLPTSLSLLLLFIAQRLEELQRWLRRHGHIQVHFMIPVTHIVIVFVFFFFFQVNGFSPEERKELRAWFDLLDLDHGGLKRGRGQLQTRHGKECLPIRKPTTIGAVLEARDTYDTAVSLFCFLYTRVTR